jgi:hypothetical protein
VPSHQNCARSPGDHIRPDPLAHIRAVQSATRASRQAEVPCAAWQPQANRANNTVVHSITSSARASSVGGPRTFAVLRLITS